MRPRSLRGRVMMGAILWTIGLLVVVTIIFTFSAHARDSAMVIHRHTAVSVVVVTKAIGASVTQA